MQLSQSSALARIGMAVCALSLLGIGRAAAQTYTMNVSENYRITSNTNMDEYNVSNTGSALSSVNLGSYSQVTTNGDTLHFTGSFTFAPILNSGGAGTTVTIDNAGDIGTLAGGLGGTGSSNVGFTGTGTFILQGTSSITSGITIGNGSVLQVDGSVNSASSVTVNSGGTLRGTGTIGQNVTVSSGAFLAAGTSSTPGTLNIAGNLTLANGSTTTLRVNSASSYDKIVASGNVTLGGTSTLNLTLGSGLLNGDSLTLIKANGSLSGTFGTTNVTNNLNNALSFKSSYVQGAGGEYDLVVTAIQKSFVPFSTNGNQNSVARVLDGVVGDSRANSLISALNALPGGQLASALNLISPVQATSIVPVSLSVSRDSIQTLNNRMGNIRAGSTGLSLNQINLIDQNIPASALLAGTDMDMGRGVKILAPDPKNKWGFFAASTGNFGNIDGDLVKQNYHGAGITLGSDYRLDRSFAVGFAAGYDYSRIEYDASSSNNDANTVRFGPYATWKNDCGDWVDGSVGGAQHWYSADRQGFGGVAASNTTGLEFDGSLKYGHDFRLGKNREWTLTPTLGLNYMHIDVDGYTESGSLAPLSVRDQVGESFLTNLGGTVSYDFTWKKIAWTPFVGAGWAHEYLKTTQTITSGLASGAGAYFNTTSDDLGHDSATFGIGLRAGLTDDVAATISYSGQGNGTYLDNTFNAAVRVSF